MTIKLGFMASGNGTSVRSVYEAIERQDLKGFEIGPVITNKAPGNAALYQMARPIDIEVLYTGNVSAQLRLLEWRKVEVLVSVGYTSKIKPLLIDAYKSRIWNMHPSLLPKYGGKGMYGLRPHQAVLSNGDSQTGATVHMVNQEYDEGQILNQAVIDVLDQDTPESLQQRVLSLEYQLLQDTLAMYRDNALPNCPRV